MAERKRLCEGWVRKPRGTEVEKRTIKKLGNLMKTNRWQERYMWMEEVVTDVRNVYLCYSNEPSAQPLKRLNTEDIEKLYHYDMMRADINGSDEILTDCFGIRTCDTTGNHKGKNYLFSCMGESSRSRWIAALEHEGIQHVDGDECDETDSDDTEEPSEPDLETGIPTYLHDDDSTSTETCSTQTDYEEEYYEEETDEDDDTEDHQQDRRREDTHGHGHGESIDEGTPSHGGSHVFIDDKRKQLLYKIASPDFACDVVKCSSKDKDQDRIIMISRSDLYIIEQGRLTTHKKRIPITQVTNVIRNNKDNLQEAIIWPKGHDYLLTFKRISDLTCFNHVMKKRNPGFTVRWSNDIFSAIRRSENDEYEPLEASEHDHQHVATNSALFPKLRASGDVHVLMSDVLCKVDKGGEETEKLIVVTDVAVYYFPSPGEISQGTRRIDFKDIKGILHNLDPRRLAKGDRRYILIQVEAGTAYGDKAGDLLLSGRADAFFTVFIAQVPQVVTKYRQLEKKQQVDVKYASSDYMVKNARLEKRDAVAKTFGGAKKMTGALTKHGKKLGKGIKRLGGTLDAKHVKKVAKGVKHMAKDLPGMWIGAMDSIADAAGSGVHGGLLKACEEIRLHREKLTSSRGNAVFAPVAETHLKELMNDPRAEDPDTSESTVAVRGKQKHFDIPQEKVWYAAWGMFNDTEVLLVLTSLHISLFNVPQGSGGSPKEKLSAKARIMQLRITDLLYLVECPSQPDLLLLIFKKHDYLVSFTGKGSALLLTVFILNLSKRLMKKTKLHSVSLVGLRSVGNPAMYRILQRKHEGDPLPRECLVSQAADYIHLATCEKVLELLKPYKNKEVLFSGVAVATALNKQKIILTGHFVAVTESAVYLLVEMQESRQELRIKRRIGLHQISGLLVNDDENRELVTQVMDYEVTLRYEAEENQKNPVTIRNILEEAFKVKNTLKLNVCEPGHIVFEVFPASYVAVGTVKKMMNRALTKLESTLSNGAPIAMKEKEERNDLWLKFSKSSEDYITQVNRARDEWAPLQHADYELSIRYSKNDKKPKNEKPGKNDVPDLIKEVRCKVESSKFSANPVPVLQHLQSWFEAQLTFAVDDPTALQHELERGTRLGLTYANDTRECVIAAKAKVTAVHERHLLLSKLRKYIDTGKFRKFDELLEKAVDIKLEPIVTSYCNKEFRTVERWSRLCGCPLRLRYQDGLICAVKHCTVQEAIDICKATPECVGFTYIGSEIATGEVEIKFRTSVKYPERRLDKGQDDDKRDLVALDIVPNPSALVDVLYSTTWLKRPDELKLLKKEKVEAVNRKKMLEDIKAKSSLIARSNWKSCGMEVSALVALEQKAVQFPLTDRNLLLDYQLRFSAAIQRRMIREWLDTPSYGEMPRLLSQSWTELVRDDVDLALVEIYRDKKIKKLARSMHNCLLDFHTCSERENTALEEQYWDNFRELNLALSEYEKVPPQIEERLFKQRWRSRDYAAEEEDADELKMMAQESLHCICVQKQIKECVNKNDRGTLEELRQSYTERDLDEDFNVAYAELNDYKERKVVVNKAGNSLNAASRLFKDLNQASEQEVASVVQTLVDLGPVIERFPSLEDERYMTVFLLNSLRSFLQGKAESVERQAAQDSFEKAAEEANRQRFEMMQERLDKKEVEKQVRDQSIAEKYYSKAKKMKAQYEDNVSQVGTLKCDLLTASQQRKDCASELENAKSQAKHNSHESLKEAVGWFEDILGRWDNILGDKDELEKKALTKEVDNIIEDGDAKEYLVFLKSRGGSIPQEELRRIRLAYSALVSKKKEMFEACEAVEEAMKYRAGAELETALKVAELKGVGEDQEVIVKARTLLMELRSGSPNMRSEAMNETVKSAINLAPEGSEEGDDSDDGEDGAASEKSFIDSEEDEQAGSFQGANPFINETRDVTVTDVQQPESEPEEPEPSEIAEPTLLDEVGPPRGRAQVQQLRETIMKLIETSELDSNGIVRCHSNNPHTRAYVTAWMDLLRYNLKQKGKLWSKKSRTEMDLLTALESKIFNVHRSLEGFKIVQKLNPQADLDRFLMYYLMQSGRFYEVITDIISSTDALEMYTTGAVFLFQPDMEALFKLLKVITKLRFDFGLHLSNDDLKYLEAIDERIAPAKPVLPAPPAVGKVDDIQPEPEKDEEQVSSKEDSLGPIEEEREREREREKEKDGSEEITKEEPDVTSCQEALSPKASAAAEEDEALCILANSHEFNTACERGKLKIAVTQLLKYVTAIRAKHNLKRGEKLKEAFAETKHHAVGVLVRERICPAIIAIMSHGYKGTSRFRKRHLWQFLETVAGKSGRGSALAEDLDTVKNVIGMKLASLSAPTRSGHSINDLKLRALIIQALNKRLLSSYLETCYDLNKGSESFNKDWYSQQAVMLDAAIREELDPMFSLIQSLNFHIHLDADVW
eukprot:TRINITY_DN635_c1_g1_i1.p1 TRINITY_DN635_c1_g1~~TRINITY_DN635_c1_g1_i1.p1  ORF type:complete len:2438 (+),score=658.21 TRINITY_DN635_c1_g1_i1:52-7314(+)